MSGYACSYVLFMQKTDHEKDRAQAKRTDFINSIVCFYKERLSGIYDELGGASDGVPIYLLFQHPVMRDCINMCKKFKLIVSINFHFMRVAVFCCIAFSNF